jgi:hypothetical protein
MRLLLILLLLFCYVGHSQMLLNSYRYAISCIDPYPSNPNPQLNLANASAFCEDETADVPTNGGTDNQISPIGATVSSVTDANDYGTRALEVTATGTSGARNRHYFTLINGQVYQYTIVYKMQTGTNGRWRFVEGSSDAANRFFSSSSWAVESGEFTATTTRLGVEVYSINTLGSVGDKARYKFYLTQKND